MDKEDEIHTDTHTHTHTHTHSGILLSPGKKNEVLHFATIWADLEDIMLSEISQMEKDKCHMISFEYGILNKRMKKES